MKKERRQKSIITLAIIFWGSALSAECAEFLKNFTRPFTFLEISDSQNFNILDLAANHNGVFVALCTGEKINTLKKRVTDYKNVVLLHPKEFIASSVVQLASCEHFDVTYVHDCALLQKNPYILGAFLELGDYLIIEVPIGFVENFVNSELQQLIIEREGVWFGKERVYFKKLKHSLSKARWYMSAAVQAKQPSYTIVSTFQEKKLVKGSYKKISEWIPGINLVTALMLRVKYPTNDLLRMNIKKFREIDHNDPVIGNMVVQGEAIKLIDFGDYRRNADQEKCLNAALKLFTWIHRPDNPEKAMQKYSEYVHQ